MTDYLVSTTWLTEHLADENLRILDVTAMLTSKLVNLAKAEYFDKGHIPGAIFFDVAAGAGVLSRHGAPLPWMCPDKEQFEACMAEYGIDNQSHVILVARTPRPGLDAGTMWCTRAWWVMHHFGVNCSILQGGLEAWEAEGRTLTQDVTPIGQPSPQNPFIASEGYQSGFASLEDVKTIISDQTACLIDTLSESSYNGLDKGYGPRKGHISGAVSKPYSSIVTAETAAFLSESELAEQLSDVMQKPQVITYCGGAIAATVIAFAMHLLGHRQVRVYDASLMEWTQNPNLPMTDLSV